MEWVAIAGGVWTLLSIANLVLSWRSRADLSELKLSITERLVESEKDTRAWVAGEFARRDTVDAKLEAFRLSTCCGGHRSR